MDNSVDNSVDNSLPRGSNLSFSCEPKTFYQGVCTLSYGAVGGPRAGCEGGCAGTWKWLLQSDSTVQMGRSNPPEF